MVPLVVFIFLSVQLLVVSYVDLKIRKISNIWLIINLFFFCILTFVYPQFYFWKMATFLVPVVFIIVGFLLFFMNIMGGGDSKYLASFYLLVPLGFQDVAFVYLLYTTVVVGSFLLLFNLVKNFDDIILVAKLGDVAGVRKFFGKKFTYAPVIFIAWMWFGWRNYLFLKH